MGLGADSRPGAQMSRTPGWVAGGGTGGVQGPGGDTRLWSIMKPLTFSGLIHPHCSHQPGHQGLQGRCAVGRKGTRSSPGRWADSLKLQAVGASKTCRGPCSAPGGLCLSSVRWIITGPQGLPPGSEDTGLARLLSNRLRRYHPPPSHQPRWYPGLRA